MRASGGVRFTTAGEFKIENSAGEPLFIVDEDEMTFPRLTRFVATAEDGSAATHIGRFSFCALASIWAWSVGSFDEDIGDVSCNVRQEDDGNWVLYAISDERVFANNRIVVKMIWNIPESKLSP